MSFYVFIQKKSKSKFKKKNCFFFLRVPSWRIRKKKKKTIVQKKKSLWLCCKWGNSILLVSGLERRSMWTVIWLSLPLWTFECYYFHYNVYIQGFKMNTNLTNLYMEWVRDNDLENIPQINNELGLDDWIFIIIGK